MRPDDRRDSQAEEGAASQADALLVDLLGQYLALNLVDAAGGDPVAGWAREVRFQAARAQVCDLLAAGLRARLG